MGLNFQNLRTSYRKTNHIHRRRSRRVGRKGRRVLEILYVSPNFITLIFTSIIIALLSAVLQPSVSPVIAQNVVNNQAHKHQAERLSRLGTYHLAGKNFQRAINSFSQALLIYQQIDDRLGIGKTLEDIGYVYYRQKKYAQALNYYEKSLPFQQQARNGDGERLTLKLIGDIYFTQGRLLIKNNQYRKSLSKFEQGLVYYKKNRVTRISMENS